MDTKQYSLIEKAQYYKKIIDNLHDKLNYELNSKRYYYATDRLNQIIRKIDDINVVKIILNGEYSD